MQIDLNQIVRNIIEENYRIDREEAQAVYLWPHLEELKAAAGKIASTCGSGVVDVCTLINARQGQCSENCRYCAQSRFWNTGCGVKGMISPEGALVKMQEALAAGVDRICIITSGRVLCGKDFETALEIVRLIRQKSCGKMKVCASMGMLDAEQLAALKEAGVHRVHHNLETSRSYFPQVCSSHTYEQKLSVIRNIRKAGLELCSGGIIGMGESITDRIDMAFVWREVKPESIPVNILTAVKGTPFESMPPLSEEDFYRTLALFRFVNPDLQLRFAAGRIKFSDQGAQALRSGADAYVAGNLLTLPGPKMRKGLERL